MRTLLSVVLVSAVVLVGGSADAKPRLLPDSETGREYLDPSSFKLSALQFAAGAGAAVVTVPATLALAGWLGTLSSNLYLAAIPAALTFVALPALAVTIAEAWVGSWLTGREFRVLPSFWIALGTQTLMLVGGILAGAYAHNLGDAALLTVVNMLVLPAATTAAMRVFEPAPGPSSPLETRRPAFDPSSSVARRPAALAAPILAGSF